jgi:hypothetical protein
MSVNGKLLREKTITKQKGADKNTGKKRQSDLKVMTLI